MVPPIPDTRDPELKLADYFSLASVRHHLIVSTESGTVIHREKAPNGALSTRILKEGELRLDPPGIAVSVESLFA